MTARKRRSRCGADARFPEQERPSGWPGGDWRYRFEAIGALSRGGHSPSATAVGGRTRLVGSTGLSRVRAVHGPVSVRSPPPSPKDYRYLISLIPSAGSCGRDWISCARSCANTNDFTTPHGHSATGRRQAPNAPHDPSGPNRGAVVVRGNRAPCSLKTARTTACERMRDPRPATECSPGPLRVGSPGPASPSNAMAPGLVTDTNLYRDLPADIHRQLEQQPSRSLAEGADTAVWLAASEIGGVNGKFYEQRAEQPCQFRDVAAEEKLWALCQAIANTTTQERIG